MHNHIVHEQLTKKFGDIWCELSTMNRTRTGQEKTADHIC